MTGMVSDKDAENFLVGQLKKQSPEGIRAWLRGEDSMIPVVVKHRKLIKTMLKMNKEMRKRLEGLTYEEVVKNVCSVYPELEEDFKDAKVKAKVESEIATIKNIILGDSR